MSVKPALTFVFSLFVCTLFTANAHAYHTDPINGGGNGKDTTSTTTEKPDSVDTTVPKAPAFPLDFSMYRDRYGAIDLLDKIVDNQGEGCEELYGTRNFRPILHGVAYRGGANNYFHNTAKRRNQNPLPNDGVRNLCEEGFSASVYLYRKNWTTAPGVDTCDCINETENVMDYHQLDYFDSAHVHEMIKLVHKSITEPETGPVYFHCWNGWHASGYTSAVLLKQYCKYSDMDAVNYWDLGTDGMNRSPRYQTQRDRIKAFKPYPEYEISDSLQACLCPPMPDDIDSSKLHISLDHLITVPEAIPSGQAIMLTKVKFQPGSSNFSSSTRAKGDMNRVVKALNMYPNMRLEVGGHTDNSGQSATNYKLSKQRAKRVYDYLINQGIATERLSYKGYGPSKPVASNRYKSTRAQNRRIEVKITSKGKEDFTKLVDESLHDESLTASTTKETTPVVEATKKPESKPKPVKTEKPAVKPVEVNLSAVSKSLRETLEQGKTGSSAVVNRLQFEPYSIKVPRTKSADFKFVIQALRKNPNLKVEIGGYTDSSGDKEGNRKLSHARAKSVYTYLINQGISKSQVRYKGYGVANPRHTNDTKEGRAKNRRIEVKVL